MKRISSDHIKNCLINAEDLLDEARLLLSFKKAARSYVLSHLACEETYKATILYVIQFLRRL